MKRDNDRYKLLIVDDEEIELYGMETSISWEDMEIEVVGTARNGVEGLQRIRELHPDIVITDIKMPKMDGISLIRQSRIEAPDIEFVVLSGYGEYEFTSQVMEEGVRFYLLKPCDEKQINTVMKKVIDEIRRKKERQNQEQEYRRKVDTLLPQAKYQVFRDMLLGGSSISQSKQFFMEELESVDANVQMIAFQKKSGMDYLERFVLENILTELLGDDKVFFCTQILNRMVFLIGEDNYETICKAAEKANHAFARISEEKAIMAISEPGLPRLVKHLYEQVDELLRFGELENHRGLLSYSTFRQIKDSTKVFMDYEQIAGAESFDQLLFEIYLAFLKMDIRQYTLEQKEEACTWVVKVVCGETLPIYYEEGENKSKEWQLLEVVIEWLSKDKGFGTGEGKEGNYIKQGLFALYRHLNNPNLSVQFIAGEELYINKDYFSKMFLRNRQEKFSTYLAQTRVELAKRLWQFDPYMRVALVSELTGYLDDGRYFSQVFRKMTGMAPSEYRQQVRMGDVDEAIAKEI